MIGDIISELRKDNQQTQKDLARVLNVSVATISHYESETNLPDAATLVRIADYFGVSIDYLMGRTRIRMDFNMFSRDVRMLDNSVISAEKIMARFLQLSDKSQMDVVNLIDLFRFRDLNRHKSIISPMEGMELDERMMPDAAKKASPKRITRKKKYG